MQIYRIFLNYTSFTYKNRKSILFLHLFLCRANANYANWHNNKQYQEIKNEKKMFFILFCA